MSGGGGEGKICITAGNVNTYDNLKRVAQF